MALLTGKLKMSKATPSGNNNTRNHCHQYLQELKHSLASYPCSMYPSAELHIVTLGLIWCLFEMTWATHLWVALPGVNNPRFLLNHHVFFPPLHYFFKILPRPLSLPDYSPWQQTKKSNEKTYQLHWSSKISLSCTGHLSHLHSKESNILFRTRGNNRQPQWINGSCNHTHYFPSVLPKWC